MKVFVTYSVVGWSDSDAYRDEVEYRTGLLGPNHWSMMSMAGPLRNITLHVEEELATLFALKYHNCRVDKKSDTCTITYRAH